MNATYSSGNPMPYFPFSLADYLGKPTLTLDDWSLTPKKRRGHISPDTRKAMIEARFQKTVQKYIDVILALGGEPTSLQIANKLGYNTTSMANTLHSIARQTSFVYGIKLTKKEYIARGIRTGSGPLPYLWRYNPNGIIYPRASDI
jgi:hypothetical protein